MGYSEYESLLLHFFIGPPSSWPNDDLNMFALCVRDWLGSWKKTPPTFLRETFTKYLSRCEKLSNTYLLGKISRYSVIGAGLRHPIGSFIYNFAPPRFSPDAQTKHLRQLSMTYYTSLYKLIDTWTLWKARDLDPQARITICERRMQVRAAIQHVHGTTMITTIPKRALYSRKYLLLGIRLTSSCLSPHMRRVNLKIHKAN